MNTYSRPSKLKLKIPHPTIEAWEHDLNCAGSREIGGVLFGEQIKEGEFRIVDATRQHFGGTQLHFHRRGRQARKDILALHDRYGRNTKRFNYLGEWHSHPNAPTIPSMRDEVTMYQLLADQAGAVNFLVLAIVRLAESGTVEIGARSYLSSGQIIDCEIVPELTKSDTYD